MGINMLQEFSFHYYYFYHCTTPFMSSCWCWRSNDTCYTILWFYSLHALCKIVRCQKRRNRTVQSVMSSVLLWSHMRVMSFQITGNSTVCSTTYANNKVNIKALHYWSFVMGIHRSSVDSPHKGPVCWKRFYAMPLCMYQSAVDGSMIFRGCLPVTEAQSRA